MRRISFTFVALLLLTLTGSQTALAASSTTSASAKPLDLPAMFLVPADVKQRPDADLNSGALYGMEEFRGQEAIAVKAAGFMYGYSQILAAPNQEPKDRTWSIATYLDLFKTSDGAHAGYQAEQQTDGKPVKAKTIGDESQVLRDEPGKDPDNPNRPDNGYTIVFREGRVVATIFSDQYDGKSPSAADTGALARLLASRIEGVQSGKRAVPDLSLDALHFDLDDSHHYLDNYMRLDGKDQFGPEHEKDLPAKAPTFDEIYSHAMTVYYVSQWIGNRGDLPFYLGRLATFTSRYWAAKYVKNYLAGSSKGPDGWQDIEEIKDAKDFGDQSHTATYTYVAPDKAPADMVHGTVIVARFGALAVSLRVEAFRPVPVALVEDLMATQERCVQSSARCPQLDVPASMDDLYLEASRASGVLRAWRPAGGVSRAKMT